MMWPKYSRPLGPLARPSAALKFSKLTLLVKKIWRAKQDASANTWISEGWFVA